MRPARPPVKRLRSGERGASRQLLVPEARKILAGGEAQRNHRYVRKKKCCAPAGRERRGASGGARAACHRAETPGPIPLHHSPDIPIFSRPPRGAGAYGGTEPVVPVAPLLAPPANFLDASSIRRGGDRSQRADPNSTRSAPLRAHKLPRPPRVPCPSPRPVAMLRA